MAFEVIGSLFKYSYLEFVLLTRQTRPLLLPEVVGLDNVCRVYVDGEELLQHLQDGLDRRPRGAAHVDHNGECQVADVIAERKEKKRKH